MIASSSRVQGNKATTWDRCDAVPMRTKIRMWSAHESHDFCTCYPISKNPMSLSHILIYFRDIIMYPISKNPMMDFFKALGSGSWINHKIWETQIQWTGFSGMFLQVTNIPNVPVPVRAFLLVFPSTNTGTTIHCICVYMVCMVDISIWMFHRCHFADFIHYIILYYTILYYIIYICVWIHYK
jgi:hypothetical protein